MSQGTGNPLLNPVTGNWKGPSAGVTGQIELLRAMYIELRIMNAVLAAGLNQDQLLGALRADVTSVLPDAQIHEYSDVTSFNPDPTD